MKEEDLLKKISTLLLMLTLGAASLSAASRTTKHTIKSGDTLYAIAHKNHTTINKLRKLNHLKKGEALKVGKVLRVPTSAKAKKKSLRLAKKNKKHSVKTTKHKKRQTEKKLASALKNIHSQKISKVKKHKFSLSDLIFKKSGSSVKGKKLIALAKKKLGKRYVWGATGQKNTFDCSGLTTYVCKKNGIHIPRRAIEQSKYGKYVKRSELKPGDLVFFDTSKRHKGYVNHVGIYIGNNKFIHASSAKKKVIITSLNKNFYSKRYKGARRVGS
jgi:cell wall-associated NlpC family hydrolase